VSAEVVCPTPLLRPGAVGLERVEVQFPTTLIATFLLSGIGLGTLQKKERYVLTGGARRHPKVVDVAPGPGPNQLTLTVDTAGDFSVYTLTLLGDDVDPLFTSYKLRFRLACEDPFDCRPAPAPAAPFPEEPVLIDYLSKDYASFRQALLDFVTTRFPPWTERSEADIGIALLELFAATGDNLSYLQDRVANEAFLGTATQRRSVADHLALIGYEMDEGASAHTWLQFQVLGTNEKHLLPEGFQVQTADGDVVFETLGDYVLEPRFNGTLIYDWGTTDCCLPSDSVSAVVVGSWDGLRAGDWLLFSDEARGFRDIVQLSADPQLIPPNPILGDPTRFLTRVRWTTLTPLAHDYCVADSVVRGNLALATHGATITPLERVALPAADPNRQRRSRLRVPLQEGPLASVDASVIALLGRATQGSASPQYPQRSVPQIHMTIDDNPQQWLPVRTLLDSGPADAVFRIETADAGPPTLVFGRGGEGGDGSAFGRRPPDGSTLTITYHVGGGSRGNVGSGTLTVPSRGEPSWFQSVSNPLAAGGGRDPESRQHARLLGPAMIEDRLVSVTPDDYEVVANAVRDANGLPLIARSAASFRWTGSWLTVGLALDPIGSAGVSKALAAEVLNALNGRRLAGYDLELLPTNYLPLQLKLLVCVATGFLEAEVRRGVIQALTGDESRPASENSKALFRSGNFGFGQALDLSKLYQSVMQVPGVEAVIVQTVAPLHSADPAGNTQRALANGFLAVQRDQVIQLDNDRNFPEHGTLAVVTKGGR
jgi:hypothetical protein